MTRHEAQPVDSLNAKFLGAFNDIEGHFRHTLNREPGVPFTKMLGEYEGLSTEQQRFWKAMARLRNVISHEPYFGGHPIAEPNPCVPG